MSQVFWVALALPMVPCLYLTFLHSYRLIACSWEKDPDVEELERLWRR